MKQQWLFFEENDRRYCAEYVTEKLWKHQLSDKGDDKQFDDLWKGLNFAKPEYKLQT